MKTRTCRLCKSVVDDNKIKNELGEFSPSYSTGFCSTDCYNEYKMKAITPKPTIIKSKS